MHFNFCRTTSLSRVLFRLHEAKKSEIKKKNFAVFWFFQCFFYSHIIMCLKSSEADISIRKLTLVYRFVPKKRNFLLRTPYVWCQLFWFSFWLYFWILCAKWQYQSASVKLKRYFCRELAFTYFYRPPDGAIFSRGFSVEMKLGKDKKTSNFD